MPRLTLCIDINVAIDVEAVSVAFDFSLTQHKDFREWARGMCDAHSLPILFFVTLIWDRFLIKKEETKDKKWLGKRFLKMGSLVLLWVFLLVTDGERVHVIIYDRGHSSIDIQASSRASILFWSMKKPKRANRKKRNAKGTSVWPVWVSFHQWKRAFEGDMIFEGSMYGWPLLFLAKKGKNRPDWLDHKTRTYLIYWSLKWMCLII